MKQLLLTNGTFAEVDNEDYERLAKFSWNDNHGVIKRSEHKRSVYRAGRKRTINISLASEVMNRQRIEFDHIDRNFRNNKKSNLREATSSGQSRNRNKFKNKSSKYRGVRFHKKAKKWVAAIGIYGRDKYLGCFKSEEKAAQAYDMACIKLGLEFANLNFKYELMRTDNGSK